MRYWPEPSVTAVRTFSMSAGLAASTVTPGSTAPDVSFTTPVIDAWAIRRRWQQGQTEKRHHAPGNARFIVPPEGLAGPALTGRMLRL